MDVKNEETNLPVLKGQKHGLLLEGARCKGFRVVVRSHAVVPADTKTRHDN